MGLSGGVDSSVAAYALKQQGYDVIGLFMKNWHDTTGLLKGDCPFDEDFDFARMVARKLQIPFEMVDLSEEYRRRVVDYMFSEYSQGRNPNPDVICNREIKFDALIKASQVFNPDFVATGHYCRKEEIAVDGKPMYRLLAGRDANKDQSYFLCQLSQQQLSKALFPIGDVVKSEVRRIAGELGLATAQRKDSQGICFVGKVDLPVFLQQKLKAKQGSIIEIPQNFPGYSLQQESSSLAQLAAPVVYKPMDGKLVGQHKGAYFYTIGQRKGLPAAAQALYVWQKDTQNNRLIVCPAEDLGTDTLRAVDINWISGSAPTDEFQTEVKIRFRAAPASAVARPEPDGSALVRFEKPLRDITPGQLAVFYRGEQVLGGGWIS